MKAEIFARSQETQETIRRLRSEEAHIEFEIAELSRQRERAREIRLALEAKFQLLQELQQVANLEESNA